jgi:hypothetical protein
MECKTMDQRFGRGFTAADKDGAMGSLAERGIRSKRSGERLVSRHFPFVPSSPALGEN